MVLFPPGPVMPFRGGLRPAGKADTGGGGGGGSGVASSSGVGEAVRMGGDGMGSDEGVSSRTGRDGIGSTKSTTATNTKSWAPEDYPDPWTNPSLCMGAASSSPPQNNPPHYYDAHVERQRLRGVGPVPYPRTAAAFQQRTTLFCDPDRVLDGETIRDVVERLRSFASTFASSSSPFTGDEEGVDNVGYVKTSAEGEVVLGAGGIPSIKTTITTTTTTVDSKDVAMDAGYDDGAEVRMSTPARSSDEGINVDPSGRRGRRRARSVSRQSMEKEE